jgi:APA family basic amino acid/polyamine antiporter
MQFHPQSSDDPAGADGSRLARRLGLADAVVVGLGAMIGAGVFSVFAPAAAAAGSGLLIGLAIAAVVAYCNATSSARLAAVHPQSGGTYVYGRRQLGHLWGYLAGWGFVVGKTASCAAMALTFGAYVAPQHARALGVAAIVAMTLVGSVGVRKSARVTAVIVAFVLVVLAFVVVGAIAGGAAGDAASVDRLGSLGGASGWSGILQSAGLLFFAFAGYARLATLGEEVRDPATTIPRAIPIALGITLVVYAAVGITALLAIGPEALAASSAPLESVVRAGPFDWGVPVVGVGGAVASLGALLSLLLGVGRTSFAMAGNGDLPRWLDAVHPRHLVPHRAQLAVGVGATAVVLVADLAAAIGFSSFTVLAYYAIANASAWTLPTARRRRWYRGVSVLGLAGCILLAAMLPARSVVAGGVVLALGGAAWMIRIRRSPA